MMTVRCYLAPSSIEGLGVFAHEPIAKGDVIWRFDRRFDVPIALADVAEAPAHVQEFIERYTYSHPDFPEHVILDADEGRFMNHADAPNTDFTNADLGLALRDIPVGEELTCDYACFTIGAVVHQPPPPPRRRLTDAGARPVRSRSPSSAGAAGLRRYSGVTSTSAP